MALLKVNTVSKSFGAIEANQQVSIEVSDGKIVGLIGPNGSGKTTLFNSIVGYHAIDSGSIQFQDQEISQLLVPQIARLGLHRTFQQTRIFNNMTCVDNLKMCAPISDYSMASLFRPINKQQLEIIYDLLNFVGLEKKANHLAGALSFGQQKLLELVMALMARPKLLLLDEPTAGINPTLINALIERLKIINQQLNITLLIIEHNMHVMMSLADHIYCLNRGRLLAEGDPESIRNNQHVIDAYLGAQ